MNFIQIILGRYLLEFLGALIRYIWSNLLNIFSDEEPKSFSEFWSPKSKKYEKLENEASNRIVGLIFFIIVLVLLGYFVV